MCKTFYGPCNILRGLLRPNKHQEHNIYFEIEYPPRHPAWVDEANLGARNMLYEGSFTITEAFSWLKAPNSAFTFNTQLRYYAKLVLTHK